tara:strand:+ start:1840 stop:4191 length:2352 start_codon:yes stop_codon:yes gene_type:complete
MINRIILLLLFIGLVSAQPTYEFEIISIPSMETPLSMNGAGTKIVGTNFDGQAVYWSDSTGVQVLGIGELWGISENNRIFAELENSDGNWEAALIENGESTFLGNIDDGNTCDAFYSHGLGISTDGSTGVGMGWINCGTSAFYWTDVNGIVELGQYQGNSTKAQAVSGDGQVIGGWAQTSNRSSCLWDRDGNITLLGSLQDGNDYGEVHVITHDGSQVAGYCAGSTGNNVEGYIWTAAGGITGLGVPSNSAATNVSRVFDLSENNVAVGEYLNQTPVFYQACIYTQETGEFVNLRNYLLDLGMEEIADWDLHRALCVSDDGNTIAGYGKDPSNNWTGWVIQVIQGESPGDVLLVPSEYATIQEAINASEDRDTILVAPGTYQENINYNGKNIVIGSYALSYGSHETFINQTIIDGSGTGSVVTLNSGEDSSAVLYGFTIQNGNSEYGGGIMLESAEPALRYLLIQNNTADYGGGVSAQYEGEPVFNFVTVQNNTAGQGGGMRLKDDSDAWINNCTISGNVSTGEGGGIYCNNASPSLFGTLIANNSADEEGDGIYLMINCSPSINTSTIVYNGTENSGTGLYCITNCNTSIYTSVFWGHGGPEIEFDSTSSPNTVNTQFSIYEGGISGIETNGNGEAYYMDNSDEDPLFCDPDNGDYTVASNSPCLLIQGQIGALGVGCEEILPIVKNLVLQVFTLYQNYPNPFNPNTTLCYDLPKDDMVNITIYDIMGRKVRTVVSNQQSAGHKSVQWNATNDAGTPVSAGMYYYAIQANDSRQVRKMILLK